MLAKKPLHSPSVKWLDLGMVNAPPKFVLKAIDRFGHYDACDLCDAVFLGA